MYQPSVAPLTIVARVMLSFALLAASPWSAIASGPHAPPPQTTTAAVQRNLEDILQCRSNEATLQAVIGSLREARYAGDSSPALKGWVFGRPVDEEFPISSVDMPQALTAFGISTRRLLSDGMGLAIAINAAQRDALVAAHGLQMQQNGQKAPAEVWSAPGSLDDPGAPASVIIRGDGDAYRVGCDYPGELRRARVPGNLRDTASLQDLSDALQCRGDLAVQQRALRLWDRVTALAQNGWPRQVRRFGRDTYVLGGEPVAVDAIELEAPIQVHGLATRRLVLVHEQYAFAVLGEKPVAAVLAAAGMTDDDDAPSRHEWVAQGTALPSSNGTRRILHRRVIRSDDGTVLAGCAMTRSAGAEPQ